MESCALVGDACEPLPWAIPCCNAEPGTSSSWRGGERFTGHCVTAGEQHLKDLQPWGRAEMLQGYKPSPMRRSRALQPPELSFITGSLTWGGLRGVLTLARGQGCLKERAVASRCQHEKVLGFPKAPLIQGLLWHAGIFLNVLQLWPDLLGFIRTFLVSTSQ